MVYLHTNGIVHRDIKPENIVLDSFQDHANIKLIDFGTSVFVEGEGHVAKRFGTPFYTAPEVLSDSIANEACDVWSCGVIMYILL